MKKKSAFTMIELVFVIVILGILSSLAMGRMDRDLEQEAANTILSHIRLTQQLALNDNKHRVVHDDKWQQAYWRFEYGKCRRVDAYYYRVGSDVDRNGKIKKNESAINPSNGKYLYTSNTCDNLANNESPTVLLGKKFGIRNITGLGSCNKVKHIAFDYLGRPHHQLASYAQADFSKYIYKNCRLRFEMSTDINNDGEINIEDSFNIIIESETGHAYIEGQEDS